MKRFGDLKIGDIIFIFNKDCSHVSKFKVVNISQPTSYYTITYPDGLKTYTEDFYGMDSCKIEAHRTICASEKSARRILDVQVDCLKKSLSKTYKCYGKIADVMVY